MSSIESSLEKSIFTTDHAPRFRRRFGGSRRRHLRLFRNLPLVDKEEISILK